MRLLFASAMYRCGGVELLSTATSARVARTVPKFTSRPSIRFGVSYGQSSCPTSGVAILADCTNETTRLFPRSATHKSFPTKTPPSGVLNVDASGSGWALLILLLLVSEVCPMTSIMGGENWVVMG